MRSARRGILIQQRAIVVPAAVVAACVIVASCASLPSSPYSSDQASFAAPADIDDHRGRFREIFCTILDQPESSLPDHRSCDEALTRLGAEPAGTGAGVDLGPSNRRLKAAIVGGVGWSCVSKWLEFSGTAVDHVRQYGYDLTMIDVGALSSSAANARQIRDAVLLMEPEGHEPSLVLIGYSKGTADILESIVAYPEIRSRIAAMVSVAGAVGGSPVADEVTQSKLEFLTHWPGAECSEGDGGAMESLKPTVRRDWLREHPLPGDFPYYSLATCPEPERVSPALRPTYKRLSKHDARNDGMVILDDQLIPGSRLLGCVNADHWAVSVPIERSHPHISSILVQKNAFPREGLLEAVLRFVEEDLDRVAASAVQEPRDEPAPLAQVSEPVSRSYLSRPPYTGRESTPEVVSWLY